MPCQVSLLIPNPQIFVGSTLIEIVRFCLSHCIPTLPNSITTMEEISTATKQFFCYYSSFTGGLCPFGKICGCFTFPCIEEQIVDAS